MNRRELRTLGLAGLGASAAGRETAPPKRLLLRSSWQTVNIGDIAHTPGMLALLERHLPETEVTLWPNRLSPGVESLLRARFPRLRVAATAAAQDEALARCDFALHGSGPGQIPSFPAKDRPARMPALLAPEPTGSTTRAGAGHWAARTCAASSSPAAT